MNIDIDIDENVNKKNIYSFYKWFICFFFSTFIFLLSLFFFRQFYLSIFGSTDPEYVIGFIIEKPLRYTLTIYTLYILLPNHRARIIIIFSLISIAINFSSFAFSLTHTYGFGAGRYIQIIISELINFFVLVYSPINILKYEKALKYKP